VSERDLLHHTTPTTAEGQKKIHGDPLSWSYGRYLLAPTPPRSVTASLPHFLSLSSSVSHSRSVLLSHHSIAQAPPSTHPAVHPSIRPAIHPAGRLTSSRSSIHPSCHPPSWQTLFTVSSPSLHRHRLFIVSSPSLTVYKQPHDGLPAILLWIDGRQVLATRRGGCCFIGSRLFLRYVSSPPPSQLMLYIELNYLTSVTDVLYGAT